MTRIRMLALTLALAASAAGSAVAQQGTAGPSHRRPTAGSPSDSTHGRTKRSRGGRARSGQRGGRHGKRRGGHGHNDMGTAGQPTLFNGVQPSDSQRTQMRAIHQRYAEQVRSMRESMRPSLVEVRAARARGDTAAMKAALAKAQPQRQQIKALRERQRREVRNTLTAQQRERFDANRADMKSRGGQHRHRTAPGNRDS